jgi:hypothetical protein
MRGTDMDFLDSSGRWRAGIRKSLGRTADRMAMETHQRFKNTHVTCNSVLQGWSTDSGVKAGLGGKTVVGEQMRRYSKSTLCGMRAPGTHKVVETRPGVTLGDFWVLLLNSPWQWVWSGMWLSYFLTHTEQVIVLHGCTIQLVNGHQMMVTKK